ncbi:MAG TPA: acyltransferase [Methanothrix sp.]|nr:acyltransferase [Methanothrix sp.]
MMINSPSMFLQRGIESERLYFIDALRGIAALCIFIYHIYGTIGGITGWSYPVHILPERFIDLTLAGIPLFFIISAFTLYLSLDAKSGEKRRSAKFYLRRFFRIAPLFYILLIYVLLDDLILQKGTVSWLEALANFTFTFNLVPYYSSSLFSDGWTVGVEMLFYLILPLIFMRVNNIWRSFILFIGIYWISVACRMFLGTIVGEDIMMSTNYDFYNFFHWAYIFPAGIICYMIYKSYLPKLRDEYRTPIALGMMLLSLIILFIFINNYPLSMALYEIYEPLGGLTSLQSMSTVAFVLLVLSLSLHSNRFIVNRFTRFLGMISYSLYLVHPFLVDALKPTYGYIYDHTLYSTDLSLLSCIFLTSLIALPASLLIYHLIESPGIKLGKKVISRL